LKPDGLFINPRYSQVIEVNKGKLLFIAGQMPVDKEGNLVGKGDFRAQAKQVYDNLMLALKAAGVDRSSVVKLNMYVVDLPTYNPVNREVRAAYFPDNKPNPTATAVGVTALALEGQMIEVEAVAVGKQ
jgi:2-iminobutanoate/2-iminopropanoate deaminase